MFESEVRFPSFDPEYEIRAIIWEPTTTGSNPKRPRGIIQILHGMAEHIQRYKHFAEYCTNQGFIVCGHDHIGHGKSVKEPDAHGIIPANGKNIMVEDAHKLRLLMQDRFASPSAEPLPYFMFGHSMGSFVLRVYLASYGTGIAGAVVCGTGHLSSALSASGCFLAKMMHAVKGPEHKSNLLHNMGVGSYSKQIEDAKTALDWLSHDEQVIAEYGDDPHCGFKFGAGGNIALTQLTGSMVKRSTVAAVPAHLPLFFIAGAEDPVGEKGAGVKRAVALFEDTGHDRVSLKLYPGMRHELLNEIGKEEVYDDVLNWIGVVLDAQAEEGVASKENVEEVVA